MHQHIYVGLKKIAGLETKYKEKTKKKHSKLFPANFFKGIMEFVLAAAKSKPQL